MACTNGKGPNAERFKTLLKSALEDLAEEHKREISDIRTFYEEQLDRLRRQLEEGNTRGDMDVVDPEVGASAAPKEFCEEQQVEQATRDAVVETPTTAMAQSQTQSQTKTLSTHNGKHLKLDDEEADDAKSKLRRLVENYLDITATVVVSLHILFLIVQTEYGGRVIAEDAGLTKTTAKSDAFDLAMAVVDHLFNAFFILEMLARIGFLKKFFWVTTKGKVQFANIAEFVLVVMTSIDMYFSLHFNFNFNTFRPVIRFMRLLRVLRLLKLGRFFLKLRILVMTVAASFMALFWSIVLLVLTMLVAALFLNQSLVDKLSAKDIDEETRLWIYQRYGTSTRSLWSVFELTFSGGWPAYARPLVEEVSSLWAVFFFIYIIAVVFAMFRIITALFLRDTLALAANDAETAIREKAQQKAAIAKKLHDFFDAADTSEDGMLTLEEFETMLEHPKVAEWLSLLELDVKSATDVFALFQDEDNCVSVHDFIQGMMCIKGQAKAQEVYHILVKQKQVHEFVSGMGQRITKLEETIGRLNESVYKTI